MDFNGMSTNVGLSFADRLRKFFFSFLQVLSNNII